MEYFENDQPASYDNCRRHKQLLSYRPPNDRWPRQIHACPNWVKWTGHNSCVGFYDNVDMISVTCD